MQNTYSLQYWLINAALLFLLIIFCIINLGVGSAEINSHTVWQALTAPTSDFQHLVIRTVHLPRVLSGLLIGMALAVAGVLMQGLTRNPLASPGILGINAGAAFAVVCALVFFRQLPLLMFSLFAALGAGLSAVIVYVFAFMGTGGVTPMKITLSGAIFTGFLSALTTTLLIFDEETLDQVRFWTAGSLAGRNMDILLSTAPYMIAGIVMAMFWVSM